MPGYTYNIVYMFSWAAEEAQQLGVFVIPSTKMAVTNICNFSFGGSNAHF